MMKRFFLTLCALCATTVLWAATEIVNGIIWTYTVSDGKATITPSASWEPTIPAETSGTVTIPSLLGDCPVREIADNAFFMCENLEKVIIPNGITKIGMSAFYGCTSLTSVEIPETVLEIGGSAFSWCTSLTFVKLPSAVKFGPQAFSSCPLVKFEVAEGNLSYVSHDGAIFNTDKTTLVYMPGDLTSYEIPATVKTIGPGACYGRTTLTSVTIPEGVTSIKGSAFYDCSGLTSVTIPASVTSIEPTAFYDCSGLTSVEFLGAPPSVTSVELPYYTFPETDGYYTSEYATAWEAVIDEDGKWNNLTMQCLDEASSYMVSLETIGEGTVTGSDEYAEGDKVTLTATADEGWVFCGWSTTPAVMTSEYTFTMPSEDVKLTVCFAPKQSLDQYVAGHELITKDDIKEMAFDVPVVEVGAENIEISISLQTADTLNAWEAMALDDATLEVDLDAGKVRVIVPKGDRKAAFYKFIVPTDQSN